LFPKHIKHAMNARNTKGLHLNHFGVFHYK